jgi:hypothetical protein
MRIDLSRVTSQYFSRAIPDFILREREGRTKARARSKNQLWLDRDPIKLNRIMV